MSRQLLRWLFYALALLLLAGSLYLFTHRLNRPQPLEIRFGESGGADIKVYITGAVVRPGVYTLHEGERVADAIEAAGGPTAEADLERLNLAKRLRDEDQVTVPRIGESPPASIDSLFAPVAARGPVDLNRATVAELDTLPGIGPVYAQRIVESRQRDGPFRSVEELLDRKLLPRATYERIKDRVIIGP